MRLPKALLRNRDFALQLTITGLPETSLHFPTIRGPNPLGRGFLVTKALKTKQDPRIIAVLNARIFIYHAVFDSDICPGIGFYQDSCAVESEVATFSKLQGPFAAVALGIQISITPLAFFKAGVVIFVVANKPREKKRESIRIVSRQWDAVLFVLGPVFMLALERAVAIRKISCKYGFMILSEYSGCVRRDM